MLRLRLFGMLKNAVRFRIVPVLILSGIAIVAFGRGAVLAQTSCDEVDGCLKLLESGDSFARTTAAYTLGNLRDARAIPVLLKVIEKDDDTEVQRTGLRSLGLIGDPSSVQAIGELLESQPHLQDDAVKAIIRIGGENATKTLVKALGNRSARKSAIEGLGEIGDRSARQPLLSLYRSTEDDRVRGMTSIAIHRIRSRLGPTAEEMGLPIYPDARYFPNPLAEWIFTTEDSVEQVVGFYRKELKKAPLDFPTFKGEHEETFVSTEELTDGAPSDHPDLIFVVEEQPFEGQTYPAKMIFLKGSPKKTEIRVFHAVGG